MIVGLTGKKRSGKSTAAEYIEKMGASRLNFKDALITEVAEGFPDLIDAIITTMNKLDYNGWAWTYGRLVAEKPPLFRTLLQNYGTEVRRGDHPDYWVDQWIDDADYIDGHIVADDVRFQNEAQAVWDKGGIIIKIERSDLEQNDSHVSETEMDHIAPDYTISVKTGELDKMFTELDRILSISESTPPHLRV
jgi:hypothetical protein